LKGSIPARAPSIPKSKPKPVPPPRNRFLKKLFNITDPKDVNSLRKAAPALQKAGRVVRGTPIVGPLIVFTTSVLSDEPVGQAAFKAIGAGLGEFLGTFIPIPGLGTIVGGLIGEVMGDAAYSLIIEKNPKKARDKVMNAVGAVAKVGGKILDWMKGVVVRFWESLPKTKLPKWVPFGLGGKEILDPKMFSGPLELFGTMGKAMVTALFQPSKDEKGKVDDKSNVEEGEEESPPPSTGPLPATRLEGNERELLLKLMVAEAGGEGIIGMAAVARSVLNRAALIQSGKVTPDTFNAKSGSIFDVISAPDQYTPYNNGLPSITDAQRREAIKALAMAENPADLRGSLEGKKMSASDINNIVKSTGFRTPGAGYDRSQDVNPTTLGGHVFNTAGNTGMLSPSASISQAQIAGSAVSRGGETTGTQRGDMISGFPVRSPYRSANRPDHKGIDIGTPEGTFVALSVPVEIMYAASHGDYGYVIDAWAPSLGLQFRLAHLKEFIVRKGQKLPAGTALGKTGGAKGDIGAGNSTGPHLHFEVDNKKNGTTYGGLGDPSPYVQYLILSSNGPRAGANVTTPGAVASSRARSISGLASYEQGAENTIYVPSQQQQQTVVAGGGSSPVLMAASTRDVVNSYYKQQLLGFLYKQG